MRISDWSSDVCSSDLFHRVQQPLPVDALMLPQDDVRDVRAVIAVSILDEDLGQDEFGRRGDPHRRAIDFRMGYVAEPFRSEEHTSELQSLMRISYAVFCLKKKTKYNTPAENNLNI